MIKLYLVAREDFLETGYFTDILGVTLSYKKANRWRKQSLSNTMIVLTLGRFISEGYPR